MRAFREKVGLFLFRDNYPGDHLTTGLGLKLLKSGFYLNPDTC